MRRLGRGLFRRRSAIFCEFLQKESSQRLEVATEAFVCCIADGNAGPRNRKTPFRAASSYTSTQTITLPVVFSITDLAHSQQNWEKRIDQSQIPVVWYVNTAKLRR
jgi:hypothetical protein